METCISFRRGQSSRPLRRLATLGALALAGASQAQNFNFTDTGMANFFYQKTSWQFGGGGTESSLTSNQGNPGNARQVTHTLSSTGTAGILTAHIAVGSVYTMPATGVSTVSLSVEHQFDSSSIATEMGVGLVVEQAGQFFWTGPVFLSNQNYAPITASNGNSTAFKKIDITQPNFQLNGSHPNFNPGAPSMRFGFATLLTNEHAEWGDPAISRFDNLTVTGIANPVPEPATLGVLGVGLVGLARKKKKLTTR